MSIATSSGLGEPKNFNTHMDLIIDDLIAGWEEGFVVDTLEGRKTIKVMMVLMCADTPGSLFGFVFYMPCQVAQRS
jgi:hypothetical protein